MQSLSISYCSDVFAFREHRNATRIVVEGFDDDGNTDLDGDGDFVLAMMVAFLLMFAVDDG